MRFKGEATSRHPYKHEKTRALPMRGPLPASSRKPKRISDDS